MRSYGFGISDDVLLRLVREVLVARTPHQLALAERVGAQTLTQEQREAIREVLADELVETGLDEDGEPNERGRLIEAAIDWLGRR